MIKKLKTLKKLPWSGIFAAMLTIISAGWAADAIKGDVLFGLEDRKIYAAILVTLLFFFAFLWLYIRRLDFLSVRTLLQEEVAPHKVIIILLSPSEPRLPVKIVDDFKFLDGKTLKVDLSGRSRNVEKDIAELNKIRWNWQQILRGLSPHRSSLEHVYLVGSKGDNGSFKDLDKATNFIGKYFKNIRIAKHDRAIDFENFDVLVKALERAILLLKKHDFTEKDIVIDVTGGQKTTSIAGAMITINSVVTFQYVQTSTPFKAWGYDVHYVSSSIV